MSIKISIVVPVYNVEKYIHQCVDSILCQTYENIEVILVDDGSPDNCPNICDEYAQKDNRILVIHKKNGGLSDARNAGITKATGDYVAFVDSDDFWKNNYFLEKIIERIKINNADVINFLYEKVYENETKNSIFGEHSESMPASANNKKLQVDYLIQNNLFIASACNKIIKKDVLIKTKGFRTGVLSEDIDWCAKLLCYSNSLDFVNIVGYSYRQRGSSITHTMKAKSVIDLEKSIMACFKVLKNADSNIADGLKQYIAYQYSTFIAVQAIAESCPDECIERLSKYKWILNYHGNNKKVFILKYVASILGFKNLCKLVRHTKWLWEK